MGLDAVVYCNCFETGRINSAPKPEWDTRVHPDGQRDVGENMTLEQMMEFDDWSRTACEHPNGILVHHRLGNISAIGELRQALGRNADAFPIILSKVIYSGSHGGDHLEVFEVELLKRELEPLTELHTTDPDDEPFLRHFEHQLRDLIDWALRTKKPISF
jgi:hypothetical protein